MKSATSFFSRVLGMLVIMGFMVMGASAQTVTGNGLEILDGDATPRTADGTSFGSKLAGIETGSSVFRFTNNSGGALTIPVGGITLASSGTLTSTNGFHVLSFSGTLPLMMPPGANLDITLSYDPQDGGVHGDVVSIDYTADVYDFAVTGSGFLDYGDDNSGDANLSENGARHVGTGIRLGLNRDTEADNAGVFDDATGTDDEDGVTQSALFIEGGQGSLVLQTSAAGFASAFLDANNDAPGGLIETVLFQDVPVVAGSNVVTFTVPALTGLAGSENIRARVRVCSVIDSCDTATGLAPDGEVEDLVVAARMAADGEAPVTITMAGSEANVAISGLNVVVTDENASILFSAPLASIDGLTITGSSADETVTIDPDAVAAFFDSEITVNLMGGTDTMNIQAGAAPATFVSHIFANANDGEVWVDGAHILYTGLDPIVDAVVAGHRTFTFSNVAQTITLSANGDGASANGISHIDSDAAEMVSFVNPTASLTINGGTAADVMAIGLLDSPVSLATVTVNSGGGTDAVTITPSADYVITADGGLGSDIFDVDLSGGAVIDVFTYVAGSGSVTFSSGENTITFTNFEAAGNSDLELTVNKSQVYAGDDLSGNTALIITVTNNGPADAVDAAVSLGGFDVDNPGLTITPSQGTLGNLGLIPVGGSATVEITGFLTNVNTADYTFSVSFVGDPDTNNNSASVAQDPGFAFPAKTHVNAALYVSRTSTIDGTLSDPYDKLIVGLFQGSPGIDGAVWCKIPNPITSGGGAVVEFPAEIAGSTAYFGDRWRPCAKGLPFPLHVNDLFEAADGTIWLAAWGSAGLYKSTDDGESWEAANVNAFCTSIPTNCVVSNSSIVYAITQDADGFLYISVNDGYVFRSLNNGASWQQVGSLPEVDADTPWSLVAHPTTAGLLYAGTFGRGVYVSDDYGFTWEFLGGEVENDVLLGNEGDLDADNLDNLYAGHIFDLEIGQDPGGVERTYLFAGTGNGIWRYQLTDNNLTVNPTAGAANEGWVFMGPEVTLDDASVVVPEIRSLAMGPDTDVIANGPDFLLAGSWGFGAFSVPTPTNSVAPTAAPIALRGANVTFVAVGPNSGTAFIGVETGETFTINVASASTSTANEPTFSSEIPEGFALEQNYPNPFNPVTTIQFALPETGKVRLAVYDVLGREVAVLVDGTMEAGTHGLQFNGAGLTSGTYIYRLSTDKGSFTRQLSLLK